MEKALTDTSSKLFMFLAKERGGAKLATPDAIAKMDPVDAKMAQLGEQIWVQELHLALLDAKQAAEEAYRAYPEEADAYQTGDLVKASIKEKGT